MGMVRVVLLVLVLYLIALGLQCQGATTRPPLVIGWSIGGVEDTRRERITLAGVWNGREGWHSSVPEHVLELFPGKTAWTIFSVGSPPISVTTGKPEMEPPNNRASVLVGRQRSLQPGSWIAIHGLKQVDRRTVRSLDAAQDRALLPIKKHLRAQGLWLSAKAKVRQDIAVDLNGDGKEDRLLTVYEGMGNSGNGPLDLAAVAIAQRDGKYRVTVISKQAWQDLRHASQFLGVEVVSAADLNGDGRCEIGLRIAGNDYAGLEIYSLTNSRPVRVLHVGDWAA